MTFPDYGEQDTLVPDSPWLSQPCSRLNGYFVEEPRRIQNPTKHLTWSFQKNSQNI